MARRRTTSTCINTADRCCSVFFASGSDVGHAQTEGVGHQTSLRSGRVLDKLSPMPEVVLPLIVRDLASADLPAAAWAGSGPAEALERARRGEVDYLVVCQPSGFPCGDPAASITALSPVRERSGSSRFMRPCDRAASAQSSLMRQSSASGYAASNGPSLASMTNSHVPAGCMNDSGTSPTAANQAHGHRTGRTGPAPSTKRRSP